MSTKNITTKTLNPLHFEDLEPHRFEDLVRQLAYDFRTWRTLEPTGRLGADDGYDARGFEIVDEQALETDDDSEEKEIETKTLSDRLWQLQCKREKTITPSKLEKYLDEMIPRDADIPHGVIFAAPCDFSKKARDVFQQKLRDKGVQEFYLWGKADLEDMLMLPKNDNLLFAYFGISIIIRRRSLKTQITSLLVTKRKTVKHLGGVERDSYVPILIRDASDKSYPYSGNVPDFKKRPRWKMYIFRGHTHDGIRVLTRRFPAYRELDNQTGKLLKWDFTEEVNLAIEHDDFWNKPKDDDDGFRRAHDFLDTIAESNRAFFEVEGVIPYERIIEIDQIGDSIIRHPHLYVEVKNDTFFEYSLAQLTPRGSYGSSIPIYDKDDRLRFKFFPKKLPKAKKLKPLPPMGSKKKESTETESKKKSE